MGKIIGLFAVSSLLASFAFAYDIGFHIATRKLENPDPSVRAAAATELSTTYQDAPESTLLLFNALRYETKGSVEIAIANGLARCTYQLQEPIAAQELVYRLKDAPFSDIRESLGRALIAMEPQDAHTLRMLNRLWRNYPIHTGVPLVAGKVVRALLLRFPSCAAALKEPEPPKSRNPLKGLTAMTFKQR